MLYVLAAYFILTGIIGHIDFALLRGSIGVYLSTYMPWNK